MRQIVLGLCALIIACAMAWRIVHISAPAGKDDTGEAKEAAEKKEPEDKDKDKGKDQDEGSPKVKLTEAQKKNAHLGMAEAGPAKVKKMLPLFGKIVADEDHLSHVVPRFPGVTKAVKKRLGDKVEKGEVLATIESNESLRNYDLVAEIGGTVIQKDVTVGEFVKDDKAIFIVADLSTVWVDLNVYRQDFALLHEGLPVWVKLDAASQPIEGPLAYLSPFGAESTQTMLARVVLSNPKGELRPGLFVTAQVATGEIDAPVTVKVSALQTWKDKPVVFVDVGDGFEAREVELGERDNDVVEVLSGLLPGDQYVAENSFNLKSELGKGEGGDSD
jgi:cobalt-zinc-cadmium efflux system membrane fusion protein